MRKFTFLMTLLFAFAKVSFAQTAITAIEDVKPGKLYWFDNRYLASYEYPSTLFWPNSTNAAHNNRLWCTYYFGAENNIEDPRQLFTFVENAGKLYLFNLGSEKYVSWNDDGAHLYDIPTSFVTVGENTLGDANFPWTLAFDGKKLIGLYPQGGYEYSGYLYCSGTNPGNQIYAWQIYEVGEYAAIDSLTTTLDVNLEAERIRHAEALDSLANLIEEVDIFLLDDVNYTSSGGGKIELQVSDETAPNYIWCNEPELSEGSMEGLIDGDPSTFFHSCWNGTQESVHWLQVDLGEPLQEFSISYHSRQGAANDFPAIIEVQGSNNSIDFTTITILDNDLPQLADKDWASGDIKADQPYKHLRFVVTTGTNRVYFHMADFAINLLPNETIVDEYAPYIGYVRELKALWDEANALNENTEALTDELLAMIDALNELVDLVKGLASGADDPKTVDYIAQVQAIYDLQGVGYPTGEGRETFKAAIDAAAAKPTTQARLTLADALEDYYKVDEVIMPTNGQKYTLTFVTYSGRRNYLDYTVTEDGYSLAMVQDTLTNQGLVYPETAVFTCEDNEDGTYSFVTYDGKYLTLPGSGAASGSATGISEDKVNLYLIKMYLNGQCESDVTWEDLFGLVAFHIGGAFPAPNSSGTTFYQGSLPHFMSSWTSAMTIEEYVPAEDTGIESVNSEAVVKGTYDLSGRRVENLVKGIYIVNGKKVLVK